MAWTEQWLWLKRQFKHQNENNALDEANIMHAIPEEEFRMDQQRKEVFNAIMGDIKNYLRKGNQIILMDDANENTNNWKFNNDLQSLGLMNLVT